MNMENKIKYEGELNLGGITLPCYILEDGTRVLSGRGMQDALKMVDDTKSASGHRITRYLTIKLNPFISSIKRWITLILFYVTEENKKLMDMRLQY